MTVNIVQPPGEFASYWNDRTVAAGSTDPFNFGISIEGGIFRQHDIQWTGGEIVGASVQRRTDFDIETNTPVWTGVVTPAAGGFTPGTAYITATVRNPETGQWLGEKHFILTVK
jgi:hypothetical protein